MASELSDVADLSQKNSSAYDVLPSSSAIRLLQLRLGPIAEGISFTLTTYQDYRHAPMYNALSYCWGSTTDVVEALCNGQVFILTKQLSVALRQLQLRGSPTRLWVDAVCINQHDVAERSQQVSMMKQIYTFASKVLVWLGPSEQSTVDAIKVIRKTINTFRLKHCESGSDSHQKWQEALHDERKHTDLAKTLAGEWSLENLWSELTPIFECAWFRRVWVVQEVQSCYETWFLCGQDQIEWCVVALIARAIMHRYTITAGDKTTFTFARRQAWKQFAVPHACFMAQTTVRTAADVPFLRVLHQSRCFRATDQRDKIYSMLQQPVSKVNTHLSLRRKRGSSAYLGGTSLHVDDQDEDAVRQELILQAPGHRHLDIMPDYQKTVYQVFADLAERTITQTRSLEILSYRLHGQRTVPDIPLWIPHWMADTVGWIAPMHTWQYNANSNMLSRAQIRQDTLELGGIRLGTVSQVSWTIANQQDMTESNASQRQHGPYIHVAAIEAMARTIAHDKQFNSTSLEDEIVGARSKDIPEALFADFAAWLLTRSQIPNDSFYCHTRTHYCDFCRNMIINSDDVHSAPTYWYKCEFCYGGDVDICASCHRDGKTCGQPSDHELRLMSCAGIHFKHNEADLLRLQAAAPKGSAWNFSEVLRDTMTCRIWFSTTRGHLGSGSFAMRNGDVVAVLFGARVPFILRPAPRGEGYYHLVSDCYVDGMMDGEAVDLWKSGELEVETFRLS